MKNIPIGQLAKATGVKIPTIRYYESIGILPNPSRTESQRRLYSENDIKRLGFVRHARELGFEIEDIRQLIALSERPEGSCADIDAIARHHAAQIASKISRLQALKAEIDQMTQCCADNKVATCHVIEVLADHAHCTHHQH